MGLRVNRAAQDLKELPSGASLEDAIDAHNDVVRLLNFVLKSLSFQSNFNGLVTSVDIPASSELKITHFLGVVPKWRIILRQEGNGVISDIPSGWNDKFITLKNNGAEAVSLWLLIARE